MVYAIEFERKSDPSTSERMVSTIVLAKSKDAPTLDIVHKLLERLYEEDVVRKTVLVSVAKEWEQRTKKGVRLYDLDQE